MKRHYIGYQPPLLDEDGEWTTRAELEADIRVHESPVELTPGLVDVVARLQKRGAR